MGVLRAMGAKMVDYYGHSRTDDFKTVCEPLVDHLRLVAEGDGCGFIGARGYARSFQAAQWGTLLGLWHDLGKYSAEFQDYLKSSVERDPHSSEILGRVDHSTAGAQHASRQLGWRGRLLAYCIAGHHAGLPDWEAGGAGLRQRLEKEIPSFSAAPTEVLEYDELAVPNFHWDRNASRLAFQVGFFIRMLFSCLVDADFLATEKFMSPERGSQRGANSPSVGELRRRLDEFLSVLGKKAADTEVNRQRERVLSACREKAQLRPGLFSLNVPTGGGKTYSSLAFALRHAESHQLRRIVYAIPFTSIVEQTVDSFRRALGDNHAVLEHHSNMDESSDRESYRSRLAAENWDATVVVTTNVQLFESLFASRTSRCRKLHRLAQSVIVLDEAQTLPPDLLAPTLSAIEELCGNYGSTVVLCTATQPAVERRENFPIGIPQGKIRPIIEDPSALHNALRRTHVQVHGEISVEELARCLAAKRQVLCIVNSRRHAAAIYQQLAHLAAGDCLHLSANMCPAHRATVVADIRQRLALEVNAPCRVISTQVIEAGVDVDFPTVYRAAAGLDSIAQAAGRCNREGLREIGEVIVFDYDQSMFRPPPFILRAANAGREVILDHRDDLLTPAAIEAFFHQHYWQQGGDGSGWDRGRTDDQESVLSCFRAKGLECQFRQAAQRYRLIDDAQTPVLVPWGKEGRRLRRQLEKMPDSVDPVILRRWDRDAQRFVVSVFERQLRTLLNNEVLLERHGRHYVANEDAYDNDMGLTFDAVGLDPEMLIL